MTARSRRSRRAPGLSLDSMAQMYRDFGATSDAGTLPLLEAATPRPPVPALVVVGVDCGKSGGVVALDEGRRLVAAHAAESSYVLRGEYRVAEMVKVLSALRPTLVVLERQHAMPAQGRTSCYSIGRGQGLWEGIAAALRLPVELASAVVWQRSILRGVPGDDTKTRAVLVAEARVPELDLCPGRRRKPHDGIADACCLALHGLELLRGVDAAATSGDR